MICGGSGTRARRWHVPQTQLSARVSRHGRSAASRTPAGCASRAPRALLHTRTAAPPPPVRLPPSCRKAATLRALHVRRLLLTLAHAAARRLAEPAGVRGEIVADADERGCRLCHVISSRGPFSFLFVRTRTHRSQHASAGLQPSSRLWRFQLSLLLLRAAASSDVCSSRRRSKHQPAPGPWGSVGAARSLRSFITRSCAGRGLKAEGRCGVSASFRNDRTITTRAKHRRRCPSVCRACNQRRPGARVSGKRAA